MLHVYYLGIVVHVLSFKNKPVTFASLKKSNIKRERTFFVATVLMIWMHNIWRGIWYPHKAPIGFEEGGGVKPHEAPRF